MTDKHQRATSHPVRASASRATPAAFPGLKRTFPSGGLQGCEPGGPLLLLAAPGRLGWGGVGARSRRGTLCSQESGVEGAECACCPTWAQESSGGHSAGRTTESELSSSLELRQDPHAHGDRQRVGTQSKPRSVEVGTASSTLASMCPWHSQPLYL